MKKNLFHRLAAVAAAGALVCTLLTGCTQTTEMTTTIFAMDTVMNLTFYAAGSKSDLQPTLDDMVEQVYALHNALDVTEEKSELYALNQAQGTPTPVSTETAEIIQAALKLCKTTGGTLDITAYPAVKAWGFPTGAYRVPGGEELSSLAAAIDYTQVRVDGTSITLPAGMELDLGGVTKGYLGDRLAETLENAGIQSALLDLGQSSIQAVGTKPDGTPWRVGIQDPTGESYLGILELTDQAMGTSGSYQRYFTQAGQVYCHIIDPDTAAPAQSGLASVTVVSSSCLTCDGLSTALFVMGAGEGAQFWRDHPELDFEALFITEEGELYLTQGLADSFTLAQGYEDREVTVLS